MEKTGIALFVYKRAVHTKKVLDALKKNDIDKLYIFCDGPKNEKEKDEVASVKCLIESIDWCGTEIIKSDVNKGLAESLISGFNYLFGKYDSIIVVEDDCVPSSDFIYFMKQCLSRYKKEGKVMGITGYSPPIKFPQNYPYDVFFTQRSGSHGVAVWKRSWKLYERNIGDFKEIENSRKLRREINQGGVDLFYMLRQQINNEVDSMYIWWAWTIIKNNGVCVNPVQSRIQNIGYDGTGTHCDAADKYWVKTNDGSLTKKIRFPERIEINDTINRRFNYFWAGSPLERGKEKVKKLFRLLSNGRIEK